MGHSYEMFRTGKFLEIKIREKTCGRLFCAIERRLIATVYLVPLQEKNFKSFEIKYWLPRTVPFWGVGEGYGAEAHTSSLARGESSATEH